MLRKDTILKRFNTRSYSKGLFHREISSTTLNELPQLQKLIFPLEEIRYQPRLNESRVAVHKVLDSEYQANGFVQPILDGVNYLIGEGKLLVRHSQTPDEDKQNMQSRGYLSFYHSPSRCIHLPYDMYQPYQLSPALKSYKCNFHKSEAGYYAGTIIHECVHAADDLLADMLISSKDMKAMPSHFNSLQGFDPYEKWETLSLHAALKQDLSGLREKARQQDQQAALLLYFIKGIEKAYQQYSFLNEMKSFLVQFSVSDAFGAEVIQAYLPQTSRWYFDQFVPGFRPKQNVKNT